MAGSLSLQLLEALSLSRGAAAIVIFLFASFLIDLWLKPRYPRSLPRMGYGDSTFATMRNWMGYVLHFGEWVDEGYEKYSKHDRTFVVPSSASRAQEVVLPRSQTMWMLEQPDRILSVDEAHNDMLYTEYNFLGKLYADDNFHIRVMHKSLARHLTMLIPGVEEEVHATIDNVFGDDTENWKEINLWEAWLGMVPQITNRILVGEGTCRNGPFLNHMVKFADDVAVNSFILNMFPKILHPVVGRVVMLPNWWHWWRASKVAMPVIQKRLDDMARKDAADPAYDEWEPPEDLVTWLIRLAKVEGRMSELNAEVISKRLLPVEFAAIHTTVITGHSLILDLLSSDPALGYLDAIRQETATVLREEGGHWSKNGLSRLVRTDSAIRESMRVSLFATSLVKRKVVAQEGITNPAEGWHVPHGALLMLNLSGIHRDKDIYENPGDYDAFRYSRIREAYEARAEEDKNLDASLRVKNLGMVVTSDSHLSFGHGRHACPGRFFVAHELKMIMAYLLQNYEFKPLTERPKPAWVGQTIIPPVKATIHVRRRKS